MTVLEHPVQVQFSLQHNDCSLQGRLEGPVVPDYPAKITAMNLLILIGLKTLNLPVALGFHLDLVLQVHPEVR